MLTARMLTEVMPKLSLAKAEAYLPHLIAGMIEFRITNELRIAAYLSQLAQESAELTRWEENLNYTAKRLTQVWPKRFPSITAAEPYARNPQKLANRVYNGRMGNQSGSNDGWNFRGRMPMQATGREMYELLTEILGVDLVSNPDACLEPAIAFRASAAIFAQVKSCNHLADGLITNPNNLKLITLRINGGTHGLKERLEYYRRARMVLPNNLRLEEDEVVIEPLSDETDSTVVIDSAEPEKPFSNPTPNTVDTPETDAGTGQTESAAGAGEAPDVPPSSWLRVEDWKPFVFRWLGRVWGGTGGVNFAQATGFVTAAVNDTPNWWIYALVALVIFLVLGCGAGLVSGVLLLIWYFNRKEINSAKMLQAQTLVDPDRNNLGVEIERK